jgi:hypothetical protein
VVEEKPKRILAPEEFERLAKILSVPKVTPLPSKVSVTELLPKGSWETDRMVLRRPRFLDERKELTAAEKGTAFHLLMEYLPLDRDHDEDELRAFIAELRADGVLRDDAADSVDISNVTEDKKIKLTPLLPEGITAAKSSEKLYLSVKVKSLISTKEVNLDPAAIGISGVEEGLEAEVVSDDITVKLIGTTEALAEADADSVSASCDVSGLQEGTHKVDLKVSSAAENIQIDDHTASVKVKLIAGTKQETENQ